MARAGSPAHAGIDLYANRMHMREQRFPRPRGDRPFSYLEDAFIVWVPPHGWAIGHTFEFTFSLPEPANKGGGSPTRKNPAGTGKSLKKAAPRATKPKQRTAPDPVQTDAKRQNQVEYDRQRNKSPERVEYRRLREQERRRQAKLLGLCKNCSNPAIAGQTRCLSCAEKHRQSRRRTMPTEGPR